MELGEIQRTLFIPLVGRSRHTTRKRAVLRDPKAAEIVASLSQDFGQDLREYGAIWGEWAMVLRTATFDAWVHDFLAQHPDGTVVELGTGLNSRFERVDNGRVHWVDLDLPDVIELRRRFFTDTDRRRMVAASVLDSDWFSQVTELPGPYLFVTEGVLVYLPPERVKAALGAIAGRFPSCLLALDAYGSGIHERRRRMTAKRGADLATWTWICDEPRTLERFGLRVVDTATLTRLPTLVRRRVPLTFRCLPPLMDRALGGFVTMALFRAVG